MDEIKRVIKNSLITSLIIFIYGLVIREKIVYIGMFLGSLTSILSFLMICLDVKSIVAIGGGYKAGIFSYLKRYLIYAVLLGIMGYFFKTGMLLSTTVGLLNIKFNIYLLVLYKKFIKFKNMYLK